MHRNFPTKFSQFFTGRRRCMEYGVVVMKDDAFSIKFWSLFLDCLFFPVVDNRGWNQSFDQAAVARNERFFFNPITHTATLFLALILALSSFAEFHFASITFFFTHYCHT